MHAFARAILLIYTDGCYVTCFVDVDAGVLQMRFTQAIVVLGAKQKYVSVFNACTC